MEHRGRGEPLQPVARGRLHVRGAAELREPHPPAQRELLVGSAQPGALQRLRV